ncbi:uncharacterized protein [Montipora foliosa]|uniref:uncharacterized protein n=1 Tax=Montipora foliosa TaxID=591990 RepID=UPI0035F143BA
MADMVDDLFVFGDDFEAILGILEEDEALEEEFTAVASDVQSADIICKDCSKKCKSKGGYKRHRAAKHGQDENRVNSDESKSNADKTRKTFILTAVILTKIVLKVLKSVKGNEVFSTSIRNELSSYKHKELEEGSTEFSVMKALFEGYAKNGNTEKGALATMTATVMKRAHRQPKLKMLGVQCNVTYAILHNYAKRDYRLTAYGGIVLQRFEFVKVCMGRKRLLEKSIILIFCE